MFHDLGGISVAEKESANVRTFQGDGTPFLKVPGLKNYESVRVGTTTVPLALKQELPVDATLKRLVEVDVPLIQLATTPEGERVLLRNTQSNDGIWQKGVPVYIAGDWEDSPVPVKAGK